MRTLFRSLPVAMACALVAVTASAQTSSEPSDTTRPALTTSEGDTGLWYVPTAEVLARGKWSASVYRTAFNFVPGFSNVAEFPITGAFGVARGVEVFGALKADTRIDRDLRPLFIAHPEAGGVVPRYPFVKQGWTGNNLGDLLLGVKVNLLSEERQQPIALAVRGSVKLPTGDKDAGVSTGKIDSFLDVVLSKELQRLVEVSGYAGGAFRGSPSAVSQSNGLRWGVGAGFPSRSMLRMTTEVNGEKPFDDTITVSSPVIGTDGTLAAGSYTLQSFTAATVGLTWQAPNGFFVGAGATWTLPTENRDNFRTDDDTSGDFVDYQFRVGFHPGTKRFAPPPPPPPPPPPAPPQNRAPTVTAQCDPCTVEVGRTSTLTARATDPDGDMLTYAWRAPAGTFQTPGGNPTVWTAPQQEGPVQATVTVNDGKGGTATATTTLQVVRPAPVVELTFEDVYFDFDRSSLRTEALRLLDDAVTKLQANPTKNLIIEGHTCNIGTAEYNLALGERRARSVQEYLASRGVPAGRLEIRSYGEERPKFDNAREETRRLNRRAALVVKVQ